MRAIADKVGAILMVDMAHTAGLIAAGLLDNPVKYAHIVTSTTHKTLRGPRGGIILMGKDFENPWGVKTPKGEIKKMSAMLNSAVFPGIQGGPLEHVIAAKAVAFGEALEPSYKEYQRQVQKNAQAMAEAFVKRGYKIVSGGTDNHLMLIDLRTKLPLAVPDFGHPCGNARHYDARSQGGQDGYDRRSDRPGAIRHRQRGNDRCRAQGGQCLDGTISAFRLVESSAVRNESVKKRVSDFSGTRLRSEAFRRMSRKRTTGFLCFPAERFVRFFVLSRLLTPY